MLLDGQTAVVTGSARGIGLAIAKALAAEGASVVISDVDGAAAEETAKALSEQGITASAVAADVASPDDVERLARTAVERHGTLDVFVNNAGITRDATIKNMTAQQWQQVMDVHLTGTFNGIKSAGAIMREQQRGAIVNLSSISGKVGFFGQANYSAAKAGIVALTKVAAKELARFDVRVNAVQPGLIRTDMTTAMAQEIWDQKLAEVPMGRAGEPEEVASVVLFLASRMASYVTGAVVEITGGRFM
jgi:3-oxoacyl-[acyl-carrier protein] reductase